MEERGPPSTSIQVSGDDHHFRHNNPNIANNLHDARPGTYVVQVPKDRIYRTPPPENAAIAERYRNAAPKRQSGCHLKCVLVSIIIFLLFLGFVGGIVLAVVKKDDPRFRVKRVRVTTKGKTRQQKHEFDITLASRNPNAHTIIEFDDHGKSSLSFRDKKFANGDFPSSEQNPNNSKDVKLTLMSPAKTKLPTEIQKSMNGTGRSGKHVEMSLEFRVPVKMKVGALEMKSKTISMLCHFKVNRLAKNSKVLSQDCDYSTRVN